MPKELSRDFLEGGFNLPELEKKVLAFWDERRVFEKSLGAGKGRKFVFYEGPPYANGKPGIHHVLARVVKDVVLRYKTMRGYYVPRRAGWDTHGLPVEIAAEKSLGLKSKRDIEKYGIKLFNEKAKEQVWIYKDEWEALTRRIGYWLDLKNAYVTYQPEYIESIWWTLSEIAKRKLLYKGHKVVPWCARCGTALSSHELAQGYKETTDNSVYLKLHLKPGQRFGKYTTDNATHILSWTTTPWTLPGNVALAVGGDVTYAALRPKGGKEIYILAKDLVRAVFGDGEIEIVHDGIKGKDLVGLAYEPLFDVKQLRTPTSHKIYAADFVTTTDGTGVVHTAVMYGEDDYALGKKVGLPEFHTVDEEGKFIKEVPGLAGDFVKAKETEEKIFERLRAGGNILKIEPYTHEYPYCWRCGTPILYYARTSWFIGMSKLRKELLKSNETINWMPEHIKEGRFGEWLREAKDWNLSRERYWGAPLPIWECGKCDHTEVVGSLARFGALAEKPRNAYWVMRHGESESNLFGFIESGTKGFDLTPRGKKEATAAAKALKKKLGRKKIDLIIYSDVVRTKETAAIAGEIFGAETVLDKRLEEIHLGPLNNTPIKNYDNAFPTLESRFEKGPEGGESLRDVRARVWGFLSECEKKYEGKNILIVSHEYPIWMLTAVAAGWSERESIMQKEKIKGEFIGYAGTKKLEMRTVPRNETGEIDLHRPFVDAVVFPCPKCKAGMRRVPEVADVWYDSGAMPFAQAHYPFAQKTDTKKLTRLDYPADYIAEGIDQTRGWFYTMLAIATALGHKAPYKNVVTFGLINDKFGQKMSKSKGNIVEPFAVIDKYGIDAVRWYFYTGTPFGESKNFDEGEIAKAFRRTHLIVYNSFVFWKTYADQNAPFTAKSAAGNVLDEWIIARLNETIVGVATMLDHYEIREAALSIDAFVDDLSRWYIRRSRRRLQRPESMKDHKAASATLGHAIRSLVAVMAPFTPFFAEAIHTAMGGGKESVHLEAWPNMKKNTARETKLIEAMKAARDLAAAGLAKRAEAGIKVRQPLAKMTVRDTLLKGKKDLIAIVKEEVNVKGIVFDAKLKEEIVLDTMITPELREEGTLRELARTVQELRQKAGLSPKDRIAVMLELPTEILAAVQKQETGFRNDVGAKLVEYKRSDKFQAEEETKLDGAIVWVGIRKLS